jgi:hypothetical protein
MRTKVPAISLGVAAAIIGATAPAQAHFEDIAKPQGITVDRHARVVLSALPHCHFEDGSGGKTPCTWNVGPETDGNGVGLAYWVNKPHGEFKYHYVWNRNPLQGHPARHWEKKGDHWPGSIKCWYHIAGTTVVKCPNGREWTS